MWDGRLPYRKQQSGPQAPSLAAAQRNEAAGPPAIEEGRDACEEDKAGRADMCDKARQKERREGCVQVGRTDVITVGIDNVAHLVEGHDQDHEPTDLIDWR